MAGTQDRSVCGGRRVLRQSEADGPFSPVSTVLPRRYDVKWTMIPRPTLEAKVVVSIRKEGGGTRNQAGSSYAARLGYSYTAPY